jgi:hypothetical protein
MPRCCCGGWLSSSYERLEQCEHPANISEEIFLCIKVDFMV